jgi:hypothetical protein
MKRHEYPAWFGRDYLLLVRENERSTGWKSLSLLVNVYIVTTFCKFKEIYQSLYINGYKS